MSIVSGNMSVFYAKDILDKDIPFKIYKQLGALKQYTHFHDYMHMWYVKHGECIHHFKGVSHILTRGNVFIMPPNVSHSITTISSDVELYGLDFTENFVSGDLFETQYINSFLVSIDDIKPLFSLSGLSTKKIEALLEETLTEYKQKNNHYKLYIKANLFKILAIITREYDINAEKEKNVLIDRYKSYILDILDYIRLNYNTKIYLQDVCKLTMMSPSNFSCVFKYITGRTLTEYINYIRIENAKKLLKISNKTISGVAYETGFGDTAYFDRVFKREIGISPLQYRKKIIL